MRRHEKSCPKFEESCPACNTTHIRQVLSGHFSSCASMDPLAMNKDELENNFKGQFALDTFPRSNALLKTGHRRAFLVCMPRCYAKLSVVIATCISQEWLVKYLASLTFKNCHNFTCISGIILHWQRSWKMTRAGYVTRVPIIRGSRSSLKPTSMLRWPRTR